MAHVFMHAPSYTTASSDSRYRTLLLIKIASKRSRCGEAWQILNVTNQNSKSFIFKNKFISLQVRQNPNHITMENKKEQEILDHGPFYHGTKADLKIGELLTAGFKSNYYPEIMMNHIYFTALQNGAGLAAALAKGDGKERIYIVEPTGAFENDPNVTDKKFPGNPTRSYRSTAPLKVVGEVTEWIRLTDEELQSWKERIAKLRENPDAEIIN